MRVFLPACLFYSGDFALISELSEADTANSVLSHISMGASANFTSVIFASRKLLGFLLL